jgi:signal transduction histidine kinase
MSKTNQIFEKHFLVDVISDENEYMVKLIGSNHSINTLLGKISDKKSRIITQKIKDIFGDETLTHLIQVKNTEESDVWKAELEEDNEFITIYCVAAKFNETQILFSVYPETFIEYLAENDSAVSSGHIPSRYEDNADLKEEVASQSRKYKSAEQELTDFTYSVSHDLRAPLRRLDGYSEALLQDEYKDRLDEKGIHYLERIRNAANDMGRLIDDLLKLSRIGRTEIQVKEVDVTILANDIFKILVDKQDREKINFKVEENMRLEAEPGLLKVVIQNLLENAIKYSSKNTNPKIEVGTARKSNKIVVYIKDNGVGFDDRHADKLFRAFQRLHSDFEFEGNGIGLATVKRIINLHDGQIWAEGEVNEGARFSFHL